MTWKMARFWPGCSCLVLGYVCACYQFIASLVSFLLLMRMAAFKLSHGLPWTMHLHGMYGILKSRTLEIPFQQQEPFRQHLFEVMGYMDLPSFALGRKNPSLGIWKRYCRKPNYFCRPPDLDSVEIVSGIPRSLIDIFSGIEDGNATENNFWSWPGSRGTLSQCQLWEAYRLAGVLTIRYPHLHSSQTKRTQPSHSSDRGSPIRSVHTAHAPTDIIVTRIVSHLDAIVRAAAEPDVKGSLILNAIEYPLFLAGLQADVLNEQTHLKQNIRNFYADRGILDGYARRMIPLLDILENWWTCSRETTSIHDLARERGLELGIL